MVGRNSNKADQNTDRIRYLRDLSKDDTDCSYQVVVVTETEETEEAGLEFEIITQGCREIDQPHEENIDKIQDGWKPKRLNIS